MNDDKKTTTRRGVTGEGKSLTLIYRREIRGGLNVRCQDIGGRQYNNNRNIYNGAFSRTDKRRRRRHETETRFVFFVPYHPCTYA